MDIKGKKVLVTGSEGFIGSHLVERLLRADCRIRAFVLYNSFNSWGWLDTLPEEDLKSIEVFTGDIRDFNRVKKAAEGVDAIFHLAALIGIPFSYESPACYVDTNINGTLNVLQAGAEAKVKKLVVTSTSEVYGTAEYAPIDEAHPKKGQSPYSASKIGADYLALSFYKSFGLPVTVARPFNAFGPRQSARAIIPTIITQLLSGAGEIKLGALHPKRDFVFVKDTVEGILEIAKCEEAVGEEINISSQSEISVGELAEKLIRMINSKARVVADKARLRPEKSEVGRLIGSSEKITRLTSWKPKYTLDDGLRETIEWLKDKENLKLYKQGIYNV